MRFDVKRAGGGAIDTKVHIGPDLADDVRITKRLNDDQVVEIALDDTEVRGLQHVLQGLISVRAAKATAAAPPAAAPGRAE